MEKYYAGIGSRKTPAFVGKQMKHLAQILGAGGYTLRSGGAEGADTMFESGAGAKEIFLPWRGFNDNDSGLFLDVMDPRIVKEAEDIAIKYHPRWSALSQGARKLMTRNTFQILGPDLKSPVEFVVCWTSDGKKSGGTGQALRIAQDLGIPIYNLFLEADYHELFRAKIDHLR